MKPELRHSIILTVGTVGTAGLSVIYASIVGRTLGPAAFADYAAALSLVMVFSIPTGSINPTVARFAAEYASRHEYGKVRTLAGAVAWRVGVVGFLLVAATLLALVPLAEFFQFRSTDPLVVACGIIYLSLLVAIVRGLLRGVQHFGQLSVNSIAESALRLASGVALLSVAATATNGLLAHLLAILAVLAFSPLQLVRIWQGQEPQSVGGEAIRRFAGPALVMTAVTVGFQNVDMLFAKRMLGESEAGIYGGAVTLARVINVLVTPFTTLILPLLTDLSERGEAIRGPFLRVCGYLLVVVAGPMLVFCVWSEGIMTIFFGVSFAGGGPVLRYLVAARLLAFLCHMIALFFASRKRFGFLWVYVPGLGLMIAALAMSERAPTTIAMMVLLTQCATLACMTVFLVSRRGRGGK